MLTDDEIKKVYASCSRELYVYIYRFLGCPDATEDILHDSFLNLIEYSIDHTIDKNRIRAFLYRTSHNLCINYKKKNGRVSFSPDGDFENLKSEDRICDDLIRDELQKKIYDVLNTADSKSRSIFIMKKELSMSTSDIANNLGISERTVTRKLNAVLKRLAEELKSAGFISFLIFIWLFLLVKLSN